MLKKIVVKNFMCHDFFEINLNPRVNFITGQNGSGKSAIVAALMLGFGQRATVTNRGQSVKDFIKRGRHSAVIEITLSNDDNAFEFEEYGPEITVVRKITESSSTYTLKCSEGRSHPCNAKLLNALLLHFSIQPNNPLCILTQDVARTFLQKFDPRSLYNLYSQATLSKSINESFADSKEANRRTQLQLARKREDIAKLKSEVEEAQKKKEFAERFEFLNVKIEEVKNELVWSKIQAQKTIADNKKKIQAEVDLERDKILDKIKNSSDEALKTKLRELHIEMGHGHEKIVELEKQQTKEKDALIEVQNELSNLKLQFKETDQLIQRKDREIKQLEEASNKVLKVNVPEIQRQKKELQSIITEIQEKEAVRKTTEVYISQLENTHHDNAQTFDRIDSEIRKVSNKISESRAKIELYKKGKSLALYGQWMPRFVEEINKAANMGRFTKKPKGPIGSYLQVSDPEWAPAIEKTLKPFLSQFILNSRGDLKLFNEIAESFIPGRNAPTASISPFIPSVHDYSQHEVKHPNYSSLVRILKCSDPDVLNCLLDEASVEQVLLVAEANDACQICESRVNVPQNLIKCLTKEADTVCPAPNYRFYSGRMNSKVANLLQVNPAQHVKYLERTISEACEELRTLKETRKNHEDQTNSIKNDLDEQQRRFDALRKKLSNLTGRKLELETKIDFEPVSVDLYKKDIEMSVSEKEKAEKKKDEIVENISEAEVKVKIVVNNLKNFKEAVRPLLEEKNKILQLIDSTEKDLRDKERLGAKLRAQFNSLSEKEKALKEEQEKISKTIQEMTEKAQQTPPVENARDLVKVEEDLREIRGELAGLREFCKDNTMDIAEQEFTEKRKLLLSCSRFMRRLEEMEKITTEKLEKDMKTIERSEQRQLAVAKCLFSEVLKKRDLQGTFGLDNNNQILKMRVIRGKGQATGKKGEISSLSGGEKSFATIAFIIAVWESMTVPFFVMDEFDVFTDVITRNTILKMLLEYATINSAQFIFLTPHDLSRIETTRADVTVHKINNPRA